MNPAEMVASLAPNATVKEVSAGGNKVFRLIEEDGSSIIKVYATPARERRERHALEALASVRGVPAVLDKGITEGMAWIRMTDVGNWNIGSLPKSLDTARAAGAVLRAVHDSNANISNLDSGIDGTYVATHFRSTLDRLERYRRRLDLPASVLEAAKASDNEPIASDPLPAHTRPYLRNFRVAEDGTVSLIDWEWATQAPPEWDLSLAAWRLSREVGDDAAEAMWEGYGASFPQHRLRPWIAYHASMQMLHQAESRDGRLTDLRYLVDDLAANVG